MKSRPDGRPCLKNQTINSSLICNNSSISSLICYYQFLGSLRNEKEIMRFICQIDRNTRASLVGSKRSVG
ncbi:hypothetical protein NC653_027362 [Populus alba x Populus x berolinensis]|uniref:Uncharacterized protein n=1 Tax=Populus alba x Populus x berolinensis TaxID=444605 RepID=A0AAD6M568_9ROSI|nr:hypothetical protein NC653_027362 [Populus alba x Populus x berolinensis]